MADGWEMTFWLVVEPEILAIQFFWTLWGSNSVPVPLQLIFCHIWAQLSKNIQKPMIGILALDFGRLLEASHQWRWYSSIQIVECQPLANSHSPIGPKHFTSLFGADKEISQLPCLFTNFYLRRTFIFLAEKPEAQIWFQLLLKRKTCKTRYISLATGIRCGEVWGLS